MSDRDRVLDQAIAQEFRHISTPAGAACIDAETLAAWSDGSLDASTVVALEDHASSCARCQALIAVMAKTVPAAEVSTPVETIRKTWFRWWLAPVSAAAAAVVMWMIVPTNQSSVTVEPAAREGTVAVAPQAAPEADLLAAAPGAQPATPTRIPEKANKSRISTPEAAESRMASSDRQESVAAAAPAVPAPSAPPAPAAFRAFAPSVIAVPDSSRRWRIVASRIERSDDSGTTWASVQALDDESLVGGSAPSQDACWLIGRRGVVLLSTDGRTFTHADLPTPIDVVSISATTASSATVTTADGRVFATTDGGRTWRNPA